MEPHQRFTVFHTGCFKMNDTKVFPNIFFEKASYVLWNMAKFHWYPDILIYLWRKLWYACQNFQRFEAFVSLSWDYVKKYKEKFKEKLKRSNKLLIYPQPLNGSFSNFKLMVSTYIMTTKKHFKPIRARGWAYKHKTWGSCYELMWSKHAHSCLVLLRLRMCTDWPEHFYGSQDICWHLKFKIWERSIQRLWRNQRLLGSFKFFFEFFFVFLYIIPTQDYKCLKALKILKIIS